MLATLLLTVVLNGQEVTRFGYVYENLQACNTALNLATYETTGNYSVELNCIPEQEPSPPAYASRQTFRVLGVAMQASTSVVTMDPTVLKSGLPDLASCNFYIKEANKRFRGLAGRDYVSVCLTEAKR